MKFFDQPLLRTTRTRRIPYLNGARFGMSSADSVDTNAIGRGTTVELSIWVAFLVWVRCPPAVELIARWEWA
jgi:hypothetical protein